MAKTVAMGYTDTAIDGFTSLDVSCAALNFEEDFEVESAVPGEVIAKNVKAPVDRPETIRWTQRKVANIYAGNSDIDVSAYLPSRQGTSTLIELRNITEETSSTDDAYRKLIPMRVGLSFTLPSYSGITAAMAKDQILRCVAAMFDQADVTDARIASLQRGIMSPTDL